ncbi:MAG: hypothetical protein ACU0DI_05525 [Paracoccaceae bacterium]
MILKLVPVENIQLDQFRLTELRARLGPRGADELVSRAMEELAVQLAKVHKALGQYRLAEVHDAAKSIVEVAHNIGLNCLGQVASDVASLSVSSDSAGLAASASRLSRIGEFSLVAVWDLQELSV